MATDYGLDGGARFSAEVRDFFVSTAFTPALGPTHSTSYPIYPGGSFHGGKAPGA
jgi:hypothetical protein